MQTNRLNSLQLPRIRQKTEMISLSYDAYDIYSKVKNYLTSNGFIQYCSYTYFDIS